MALASLRNWRGNISIWLSSQLIAARHWLTCLRVFQIAMSDAVPKNWIEFYTSKAFSPQKYLRAFTDMTAGDFWYAWMLLQRPAQLEFYTIPKLPPAC
jgi:hypothetical protein